MEYKDAGWRAGKHLQIACETMTTCSLGVQISEEIVVKNAICSRLVKILISKFEGYQRENLKIYQIALNTLPHQNFLLYTTVPVSALYVEQPWSSSDVEKSVSTKILKNHKF